MAIPVSVYILQTQATTASADGVANMFSYSPVSPGPIQFNVNPPIALGTGDKEKLEYTAVKSLTAAAASDPAAATTYSLFILDTSVSSSSPQTIYETLANAIGYNLNPATPGGKEPDRWDLCYLCKWLDNCTQYVVIGEAAPSNTAKMVKTLSPYGFQAVLFAPTGIAKINTLLTSIGETSPKPLSLILHDQVGSGKWSAFTFTPNLVSFDPTMATNGTYDYVKSTECRDPLPIAMTQKTSNMNFFWFVITFFFVIAFTYFLIVLGPKIIDWLQGVPPVKMCLVTQ